MQGNTDTWPAAALGLRGSHLRHGDDAVICGTALSTAAVSAQMFPGYSSPCDYYPTRKPRSPLARDPTLFVLFENSVCSGNVLLLFGVEEEFLTLYLFENTIENLFSKMD